MKPFARLLIGAVAAATIFAPGASIAETKRFRAAGSAGNWRWEPSVRRIVRGDRIVWRNPTNVTHTVTAYRCRWSKNVRLEPGERTRKRFRRRGVYKFRCTIGAGTSFAHSTLQDGVCSGMCGKVRVRRR